MQRADVVAAVAKAWNEVASKEGYQEAMARTFARCGLTARLDGSSGDEMGSELRRILEDTRGSSWWDAPRGFFEW